MAGESSKNFVSRVPLRPNKANMQNGRLSETQKDRQVGPFRMIGFRQERLMERDCGQREDEETTMCAYVSFKIRSLRNGSHQVLVRICKAKSTCMI